ncbi:MAG: Unknown protein [uncultured Sulfurovum sp.]|uniref:1-phosphatidylinositol phosphodiesterase n=1 Tax=uncultured Sulfurovum sp. TaxID=269237 RepID=A0A6S6SM66_9BACT|nr:MAG: Unknown protein [uncultured Sulfurovum sp.]
MRYTNWMKNISNDKLLINLNIPGTHDSATYTTINLPYVTTQSKSITAQLHEGIRFFDFRLNKVTKTTDDTFTGYALMHGIIPLGLDLYTGALEPILEFLNENPDEMIFVSIKSENSLIDINDKDVLQILGLGIWINNQNSALNTLTLGECRSKIIFLNRINDIGFSWKDFNIQDEYELPVNYYEQVITPEIQERTQRVCIPFVGCEEVVLIPYAAETTQRLPHSLNYEWKTNKIDDFRNRLNKDTLNINFLSAVNGGTTIEKVSFGSGIKENSKIQNNFLEKIVNLNQGCIFPMDFPDEEIISKIIDSNNS